MHSSPPGAEILGLPIDAVRGRVDEALNGPKPAIVAAPTGSGKSTRLPMWAMARGAVLVIEPRRVAARALAHWVARGVGGGVGETVGYRVRFDDRSGPQTQVLFVTPGVALNLIADGAIASFETVVVDEFHERGWEVDLVVALLRQAHPERLVLCSATLDLEALAARLDGVVVESRGRSFPVEIAYLGEGPPSERDLRERVVTAVEGAWRDDPGDVLVFLPGKAEIETCRAALRQPTVVVHGGLQPHDIARALAPGGERRVVLATNVAETSLTVPGVTTVIDSGLARMRVHQAGRSVLALVPIARSSMDQRAGRAGRVAPGRCLRLWSNQFQPKPHTTPEIERIELDDVLLRAAGCGVPADAFSSLPWVTSPPEFAVEQAMQRLVERGVIRATGRLTALGQSQAALPVSWLSGRWLADAPPALAPWLCDLAAVVEVGRGWLLPSSSPSVLEARAALFGGCIDEVAVMLKSLEQGEPRRHGLHAASWQEARRIATALRVRLGVKERRSAATGPWPAELIQHLLQRVPDIAYVRRSEARGRRKGRGRKSEGISRWGNGATELSLSVDIVPGLERDQQPASPPVAGLVLEEMWLGRGRGARGMGRLLMRCELEALRDAKLGDVVIDDVGVQSGEPHASVERRYAGVVLSATREALHGPAFCRAAAELIGTDRWRPEFGRAWLDELHWWALLAQVNGDGPPAPEDPIEYLAEQLVRLGVEGVEDFDAVDVEDLIPDLAAMATQREGIRLRTEFPRLWAYPGGVCRCTVHWRRKLVVLEPVRQTQKGDPPAEQLPRFRGFAVEFRKASRTVRLR